jgi:hypothetical protein
MTTITTAESRLPVPESDAWAYARALYDRHQRQRREGTHPKRTADVLACKFVFGTRPALQSEKFAELLPFVGHLHPAAREVFVDQCRRWAKSNRDEAVKLRKRAELLEKQAEQFDQVNINAMHAT